MANGLDCLAAQYIAAFKMGPGDLTVEHPDTKHFDIEYITYVWVGNIVDKGIWMSIFDTYEDKCIFVGKPQQLIDKYDD